MTRTRILFIAAMTALGIAALGPVGAHAAPRDSVGVYSEISDARDRYLAEHSDRSESATSPASATYSEIAQARDEYLAQHQGAPATVVASSTPASPNNSGFDWGSAAIGAAAGTGLAALLAGSLALVSLRRRSAVHPSTPIG